MKKWVITIEAENETDGMKLTNVLHEAFKMASTLNEPLHYVSATTKTPKLARIECEEIRTHNKK